MGQRERLIRPQIAVERRRGPRRRLARSLREAFGTRGGGGIEALRRDSSPRAVGQRGVELRLDLGAGRGRQQDLARLHALQLFDDHRRQAGGTIVGVDLGRAKIPRRGVENREPTARPRRHGDQRELALRLDSLGIAREARRHDLDHLALDETPPTRGPRIFDLLANRHPAPELGEHLDVRVGGVHRHTTHRDGVLLPLVPGGELNVQQRSGDLGVAEEHLVEIAHPVEEDGVGMPGLEGQVLAHHRRVERGPLHSSFSRGRSRPQRSSASRSSPRA